MDGLAAGVGGEPGEERCADEGGEGEDRHVEALRMGDPEGGLGADERDRLLQEEGGEAGGGGEDRRQDQRAPVELLPFSFTCGPHQQHGGDAEAEAEQDERKHLRQGDEDARGDVGIGDLAGGRVAAPVAGEEGACGAEGLVAHVLHAGAVEMCKIVVIGVVEIEAIGDGDVDAVRSVIEMDGEIGGIRQEFVDRCHHRVGEGARAALRPVGDEIAVRVAGLEHHRRAAHAARFEVDDAADGKRVVLPVVDKRLRTEQAGLLAIGQQENHRPRGWLLLEVVGDLEPDGEADSIIAKAGAGVDAVIVCGEDQGRAFLRAGGEEDVLHEGATGGASRQRLADIRGAQFGRIAERADLFEQAGAGFVQRGGIDRMRRTIEHAVETLKRARGVELFRGVGRADRIEGERRGAEEEGDKQHGKDRESGPRPG